jgi:hypothetical protein
VATPLHAITVNDNSFRWGKNKHKVFEEMTQRISQALALAFPSLQNPFKEEMDAS